MDALKRLVSAKENLAHWKVSASRIAKWHAMIAPFIDNRTGEETVLADKPGRGGNHPEYRLLKDSDNNYFKVKAQVIESL